MIGLKIDLDENRCKIESNPLVQMFHLVVDEGNKESISRVAVDRTKPGISITDATKAPVSHPIPPTGNKVRDRIDDWTRCDSSRKISVDWRHTCNT
jgi:hypothetical protein